MRSRPPGIYWLLFAEFWERLSYFAVLSVFALYCNERLKLSEAEASGLAGTLGALGYVTPVVGGWLADRMLGHRRALLAGTAALNLGYVTLLHGTMLGTYCAVALLSLGSGLFKPSITSCLGAGFDELDHSRRQAAFRALYLAVNLAAAAAPLAIGAIQRRLGWSAAFAACALSMGIGLAALLWARPVRIDSAAPATMTAGPGMTSLAPLAVLCVPAMAFFAVFSQSAGALLFWSRDRVDLTLGGWLPAPLTPTATCALIPILAVVLMPAVAPLRRWLGRAGLIKTASGELKLALLLASVSMLILVVPELRTQQQVRLSAVWLLASYGLLTCSELLIVPLSLSLIEALAPPHRRATYTGVWYLGVAAGSQLGSDVARAWGALSTPRYFLLVALIPLAAYALLLGVGRHLDRRPISR
jgi:POT family proton-dependent oligopeptide transporter